MTRGRGLPFGGKQCSCVMGSDALGHRRALDACRQTLAYCCCNPSHKTTRSTRGGALTRQEALGRRDDTCVDAMVGAPD
jgi:hypothetical protein